MQTAISTYDAVFEHGVFRVLTPQTLRIPEGQIVRLAIEPVESPEDILELAAQVYAGLSEREVEEIEHMIFDRDNFFKKEGGL